MSGLKIGVIAIQGDVSEHISALKRAAAAREIEISVIPVRKSTQLDNLSGLVLPGGESTTISKLLVRFGLRDKIVERVKEGMAIMGTCAGAVLLAEKGDKEVERTGTVLLGLMPYAIRRNFFGRQRESFEADVEVKGFSAPFPAVFIRAPLITQVWGDAEVLAYFEGEIVMVKKERMLALSFHPELTGDIRIHSMFLDMCLSG